MHVVNKVHYLTICLLTIFACNCLAQETVSPIGSYEVGVRQSVDLFSEIYDPQAITSFHLGLDKSYGKYLFRANIVNRFDQTGYQWEAEAYPLIGNGMYGYLAYAFSSASIISRHQAGIELFLPWPQQSESSLGLRYLNFDSGSESWLATGSFNPYFGRYMLTLRPYFIFSNTGNGQTYFVSVRRFLNEKNDYFILRAAAGVTPDRIPFQFGDQEFGEKFLLLESYQVGVEIRKHLTTRIVSSAGLDFFKQELSFDEGRFINNWAIKAGILVLF